MSWKIVRRQVEGLLDLAANGGNEDLVGLHFSLDDLRHVPDTLGYLAIFHLHFCSQYTFKGDFLIYTSLTCAYFNVMSGLQHPCLSP